jgi:hypothetical protein
LSTQSDASAINEALREPLPELRDSESLSVKLQRGLIDPVSGIWQTDAEVREMTGADEEYLAGIDAKGNVSYSDYMAALLKRAVMSIGSLNTQANPKLIDNLSLGDRDILFLGVIKATYGKTKEFQATCSSCSKDNDVVMDLEEDFKIQEPNLNLQQPLIVKLRNGKEAKLRVPTVSDTTYVGKTAKTISAQNTLMLARCTVWPDGEQPSDLEVWAKSLNVGDRNKMVKALLDVKAGPSIEAVNVPCAHCGEEMTIAIDWISLLLS